MEKAVIHFIFCCILFSEIVFQSPKQIAENKDWSMTQFCSSLKVPGAYGQSETHNRNSAFADAPTDLYSELDFPAIEVDGNFHSREQDMKIKIFVEKDI